MAPYQSAAELESRLEFDFATAVDALDHHAEHDADRLAVLYGETGERFTYAEFAEITDHAAGNLAALGVQPGERVSILTTQPLVSAVLMYALWKAGAVYA